MHLWRFFTGTLLLGSVVGASFVGQQKQIINPLSNRTVSVVNKTGVTSGVVTSGIATPDVATPGKQPALHVGAQGRVGLTYGYGDSILYLASKDGGKTFSASQLVAQLPDLGLGMSRGPQITSTANYTIITATNEEGNVYAYRLDHAQQQWGPAVQLNDVDTVAKEGFTAVTAFQNKVLAIWLDLRGNRKNKIYGVWSNDGGKSWGKNALIYQSPEGTICECCKVSAVASANGRFYVLFRNNLKGSRDLHLISSSEGQSFGKPQKLGQGTWVLQACPMDGGDLTIDPQNRPVTVWRRQGEIFYAQPGQAEKLLGKGKTPSISEGVAGSFIAWQQNGEIMLTTPHHPQPTVLTKGTYPQIRALANEQAAICTWEHEGKIFWQRVD